MTVTHMSSHAHLSLVDSYSSSGVELVRALSRYPALEEMLEIFYYVFCLRQLAVNCDANDFQLFLEVCCDQTEVPA